MSNPTTQPIIYTTEIAQTEAAQTTEIAGTSWVTTTQVVNTQTIQLSLNILTKRVAKQGSGGYGSAGHPLMFRVATESQGLPLVTHLRITILDPTGKVVYEAERDTSEDGIASTEWLPGAQSVSGIYELTVVASRDGYVSAEASGIFEVNEPTGTTP